MQTEEKKPYELTLEECSRAIKARHNDKYILFALSIISFVVGIKFLLDASLTIAVISIGLGIALLTYHFILKARAKSLKNLEFCIVKATCSNKKAKYDPDAYILEFHPYGKYELGAYHSPLGVITALGEFQRAQINDEYYLVLHGQKKQIRFVFNANLFSLSEKDFIFDGSAYVPQKDSIIG